MMKISEQRRIDLDKAINTYLERFEKSNIDIQRKFLEYSGYYKFTNEYLGRLILKKNYSAEFLSEKRLLTVLSSGDQAFNFINQGVMTVDTFDINRLTEYFALGFKKVALETLTYDQFENLFKNFLVDSARDLEKGVIENAPEEYKWFWTEFKYALKQNGFPNPSVFDLAKRMDYYRVKSSNVNPYLCSVDDYKNFQQQLSKAKITFQQCDIKELPTKLAKYDLVLLSNIVEYYGKTNKPISEQLLEAQTVTQDIFNNNLNLGGEMVLFAFYQSFIGKVCRNLNINCAKDIFYLLEDKVYSLKRSL
ncbi:MAG: hypothetical protein IJA94_05375 [Bacilli bacterium]|nr:hypothetical protein [Bacilli bacterium]